MRHRTTTTRARSQKGLREIAVHQSVRSEAHLLRPYDILVTARSNSVKVALVPPEVRVPLPPADQMRRLPELIDATEASRMTAMEALRLRHDRLRDSIIAEITEPARRMEI